MRTPRILSRAGRAGPAFALAVASSLVLCSCSALGLSDTADPIEMVIGVDVPLSGKLAAPGLGIKHSVELALAKANSKHLAPGVHFTMRALDDQADPQTSKTNAALFVADPAVAGVVGPYNSSVGLEMAPVLARGGLPQISPSNTLPALTWGPDYKSRGKKRPYTSYFRTVTSDAVQGPYAAQYVRHKLNLENVAVVSDTKAYGVGLADEFIDEFTRIGGKAVVRSKLEADSTDFAALIDDIRRSKAQLVYYGGESPQAAPLSVALRKAGLGIPLLGGDAMHDDDYLKLSGSVIADGNMATADGIAIDDLPSAYGFVSAYEKAAYPEPAGTFGPYAYDSAWALMLAVQRVMSDNRGKFPGTTRFRESMVQAVQEISFFGVTGDLAFDEYGDRRTQIVSLYRVRNGKWETVVPYGRLERR
ncbi:branched-chain amino acid ABC transporter substrate-binding protein [Kitasatospora sp. NE20-6]|uniref:branched-chain amino acid ABC transporter substrate-binding protein n=1 Tax=Kitasatospora sp. NE20-6 TaxID=2859066 RepID=UPI0038B33E3B